MRTLHSIILIFFIFFISCRKDAVIIKSESFFPPEKSNKIISDMVKSQKNIRTFMLKTNASIDSKKKRFFFKHFIKVKKPEFVYMTSMKFSNPVLSVSSDGQTVVAYDHTNNHFYLGNNVEEVTKKITGISLMSEDLILVTSGSIFIPEDFIIEDSKTVNNRYVKILLSSKNEALKKRELFVEISSQKLVYAKIYYETSVLEISYEKQRKIEEMFFPYKITLKRKNPYLKITFKVKELKINEVYAESDFKLIMPSGVRLTPMNDLPELF